MELMGGSSITKIQLLFNHLPNVCLSWPFRMYKKCQQPGGQRKIIQVDEF